MLSVVRLSVGCPKPCWQVIFFFFRNHFVSNRYMISNKVVKSNFIGILVHKTCLQAYCQLNSVTFLASGPTFPLLNENLELIAKNDGNSLKLSKMNENICYRETPTERVTSPLPLKTIFRFVGKLRNYL